MQTICYHIMASHQDLIDWYASTGMRPYLLFFIVYTSTSTQHFPSTERRMASRIT